MSSRSLFAIGSIVVWAILLVAYFVTGNNVFFYLALLAIVADVVIRYTVFRR